MKTMTLVLFFIFGIIAVGYLLGKVTIKGVSLGSAAILIVALFAGHFLNKGLDTVWANEDGTNAWSSIEPYFSTLENIGLILFVTSVGLIAGPSFFKNLVKNFKSYVTLGVVIILSGALTCLAIIKLVPGMNSAMAVGLMSGALTSTPAFAGAKEAVSADTSRVSEVTAGFAIAYPYGVVGVVLFVQLIPKLLKANIAKERELIDSGSDSTEKASDKKLFEIDDYGFGAFALTIMFGLILGSINIPLGNNQSFNLGTTGGPLIIGLIFGHFGRIGKMSLKVKTDVLHFFQELGLIFFLTGAGVGGGREFVAKLTEYGPLLFLWGALMTTIPMIIGFLLARRFLKMHLLNILGSITGGMTSTPALGTLVHVAGTSNVAAAYAATYPIALILVVLCSQFLTYL